MSSARLPVPDPPGTMWERHVAAILSVFDDDSEVLVSAIWCDPTSRHTDPSGVGNGYLRYRFETHDGLLLTVARNETRDTMVVQFGHDPEAVLIGHAPTPSLQDVLAWARACREHQEGRAA